MAKISILPPHEAQKIAAGEVVDRPANVVKELIENALDADATRITLQIHDGGKESIRISDNGCGMSAEDARLCFIQHATSKVRSIDDLATLSTFGFRGEALASIAAVSKVKLITKDRDADHATVLELEHGIVTKDATAAHPVGTEITINNLFYNVPARKKFLKKRETEWRHIHNLFYALCFDRLDVHFKLEHDGKVIHNCPPVQEATVRVSQLWGTSTAQQMVSIKHTHPDGTITIMGSITNHHYARYDRTALYFFVNNRWVKNHHLASALLKGYQNVLPPGKYPAAAVFISVDPETVDINIHPRKEEVQFLHPRKVASCIQQAVKKALEKNLSTQINQSVRFAHDYSTPPIQQHTAKPWFASPQPEKTVQPNTKNNAASFTPFDFTIIDTPEAAPSQQKMHSLPLYPEDTHKQLGTVEKKAVEQRTEYAVIGQLHKTYIMLEHKDGLLMIDQHAAHERILYQEFSNASNGIASVALLFPHIMTLTPQALQSITTNSSILAQSGIIVEPFGHNQLSITGTPVHLKNSNITDLIHQTTQWIAECSDKDSVLLEQALNKKLHARMACTAAVKAGDTLTMEHMQQLVADLYPCENHLTCPHGRPTSWLIRMHEIEKKFKRDYESRR